MRRAAVAASLVAAFALGAPVSAHDAAKAIVELRPGAPRGGEPCAVTVSVLAPPGLPLVDQIQAIRLVGEMTGHAMTPVVASLHRAERNDIYDGSFALTMAGPWKMTVQVEVMHEVMWADFHVDARRASDAADASGLRWVVELRDPVRANMLPPWTVVGVSLAAIGGIEGLALFFKRRRAQLVSRQARRAHALR